MSVPACSVSACNPLPRTYHCPQQAPVAPWSQVAPTASPSLALHGAGIRETLTCEVSSIRTLRVALANPNACGFGFATPVKYPSGAVCTSGRIEFLRNTAQGWPAVDP